MIRSAACTTTAMREEPRRQPDADRFNTGYKPPHTQASAFRLEESKTSATGVLVTRYVRDGEVRTGTFESAHD